MTGFEGVPPDQLARWRNAHLHERARRDPGPEYLSRAQLEGVWGVRTAQTNSRLRKLRAAGMVEVAVRDVEMVGGGVRGVPVYRLLKGGTP